MRRVAVALMLTLGLAACGDKLDGEVTKKDLRAAYTFIYMQPITSTSCGGNPIVCRTMTTGYVPITMYVPPCYRLTVRQDNGESKDGCVDKSRWNAVQLGEHYLGEDLGKRERKADS